MTSAATSRPRWAGRQWKNSASGPASAIKRLVHGEPGEGDPTAGVLVFLAHRGPHVGVHRVGPLDRGRRIAGAAPRRPRPARRSAPARPRRGVVRRAAEPHVHARERRGLGERAGDVVVVAHPGHRPARERPQRLAHGQHVGEGLQRVGVVGQHVDDGHGRDGGHPLDHLVTEDAGREHRVVAGHDPGRRPRRSRGSRSRPPRPACRPGGRRAATTAISMDWRVRLDGFSKISATPRPASGRPRSRPALGQVAAPARARAASRSVMSSKWRTAHPRPSRSRQHLVARSPRPRRSRRRDTVSGGAKRSAVGVTALTTRPRSRHAAATALASRPSASSAASSSPAPRTSATPGVGQQRRCSRAPAQPGQRRCVDAAHLGDDRPCRRGRDRRSRCRSSRGRPAGTRRPPRAGPSTPRSACRCPSPWPGVTTSGSHAEVLEAEPARRCGRSRSAPRRRSSAAHARRTARRMPWRYPVGRRVSRRPRPARARCSTAATLGSIAAASASRSPKATWRNPSGMGWNGSCLVGWPVAASAASVRPWKLPKRADDHVAAAAAELAGQLEGGLVGLGAGVAEEHLPAGRSPRRAARRS